MPHMNGIDVAIALEKTLKKVPKIIALSSSLDHKLLNSVKSIVACTEKPIRRQQLLYMICRGVMSDDMNDVEDDDTIAAAAAAVKASSIDHKTKDSLLDGFSVLIVEDNEVNRCVLRDLLANFGMKSEEAVNGVDALTVMEHNAENFDCVIMDVHMPIMNGIDAAKLMREKGYKLPIVSLTADVTSETKEGCLAAGVTEFLLKPIRPAKLREVLNELFKDKDLFNESKMRKRSPRVVKIAASPAAPILVDATSTATAPAAAADDSRSKQSSDNNRILVVDDTETNLMFAELLFSKVNPNGVLVCAHSGAEAIKLLKENPPKHFSMVFMDIEMPFMTGIEATVNIREFNRAIPVIALTGHEDKAVLDKCWKAGMNGVVNKPFREPDLKTMVEKMNFKDVEKKI
jgi:CheY-like chemotaxis protein